MKVTFENGNEIVVTFGQAIEIRTTEIDDDITELKTKVQSIESKLASNDVNLDELQEIVTFIKNSKQLIDNISSGLSGYVTSETLTTKINEINTSITSVENTLNSKFSDYVTTITYNAYKNEINGKIQALENGKVSVETGKGLSANDFTDEFKNKLNNLSNYDDTNVKADIKALQDNKLNTSTYNTDKTNLEAIANGKTATKVVKLSDNADLKSAIGTTYEINNSFTLNTSLIDVNGYTFNTSDLKVGDVLLIIEIDYPDYFVGVAGSNVTFYKLETQKVDLRSYVTESYVSETVTNVVQPLIDAVGELYEDLYTKEELYTKTESDERYVQKESGKGLSSNDFTDTQKAIIQALTGAGNFVTESSYTYQRAKVHSVLGDVVSKLRLGFLSGVCEINLVNNQREQYVNTNIIEVNLGVGNYTISFDSNITLGGGAFVIKAVNEDYYPIPNAVDVVKGRNTFNFYCSHQITNLYFYAESGVIGTNLRIVNGTFSYLPFSPSGLSISAPHSIKNVGKNICQLVGKNLSIDENGTIFSLSGYDVYYAQVLKGYTYSFNGYVYDYYENKPTIGSYALISRIVAGGTFTAEYDGYVAFRITTNENAIMNVGSTLLAYEPYAETTLSLESVESLNMFNKSNVSEKVYVDTTKKLYCKNNGEYSQYRLYDSNNTLIDVFGFRTNQVVDLSNYPNASYLIVDNTYEYNSLMISYYDLPYIPYGSLEWLGYGVNNDYNVLDLANCKATIKYAKVNLADLSWSATDYGYSATLTAKDEGKCLSSNYTCFNNYTNWSNATGGLVLVNGNSIRIKASATPTGYLIYELAQPITIDLTNLQELQEVKGFSNGSIMCLDSDGNVIESGLSFNYLKKITF